jgi:peptidoglycan/xylan/chitin deacetylase (PgdA/CDA1 family)
VRERRRGNGERKLSLAGRTLRTIAGRLPGALLRPLSAPVAVFFHGVEREIFDPDLQDNQHRADDFYDIATSLKAHFEVAPLSELPDALARPERHRRAVFLMSDDGYANTLHTAAEVLHDLALPWTLFVSTDHIDSGERNPMFIARLFARHAPDGTYDLPHLPLPVRLNGSRHAVATRLRKQFRFLPAERAKEILQNMLAPLSQRDELLAAYSSERFLSWDEVRVLASRGVTVGAHAHWHWALHENEAPNFLRVQVELPKQRIEAELGTTCRHFAYPFGNMRDISRAGWRAVRDAGYEYGFTTLSGTLAGSQNPWLLPRYGLAQKEPHLPAILPLLRMANRRLAQWQESLV